MNQQMCNPNHFDAFLESRLSKTEEQQFTLHLDECADCREELESLAAERSAWQEASDLLGGAVLESTSASGCHRTSAVRSPQIEQVLGQLTPTDDPEMLGRIGSYEVSGVVGAGGMGVVLKAHDRSLDRIVAIKVMSPHLASSGSARKRFAREAKAAAAVLHPNVIAIHGVASDDACPYLVMPYVRGASLQKRIDSQGPLPLKDTLRIGSQIAAGLAAAHEQGLVHRDIKPANILLEEGVERVTITDFGLARAVDDASMTCSGVIAGTPQYMSPEQTRGDAIDARSDLFSLGSVLYAMCAGRSPFRAETTYGVLHRIANDRPTPICDVNSDVPLWLSHIIERLLAKRPDDRFDSAKQVAELLEDCLAHVQQPNTTPLPESIAALAPPQGRRPPIGKFVAAATFAFSLIFAGVLIVLELNKGTLTIESEADDVPIRIMQGDKVVKQMKVTNSRESVRIAAGNYVVEIDRQYDGLNVEHDAVTVMRGKTQVVRVVRDAETISDAAHNASPAHVATDNRAADAKEFAHSSNRSLPDANGIFWSDRERDQWLAGLKVVSWPSALNKKMIVHYVLKNNSSEAREVEVSVSKGDKSSKQVGQDGVTIDFREARRETRAFAAGEVVEFKFDPPSVSFVGLSTGNYRLRFGESGGGIFVRNPDDKGKTAQGAGIPCAINLAVRYAATVDEMPIHWSKPLGDMRLGAMFLNQQRGEPTQFLHGDQPIVQFFLQNVSDKELNCGFDPPYFDGGWGIEIHRLTQERIENEYRGERDVRQIRVPALAFFGKLAPQEIRQITGELEAFRSGAEDDGRAQIEGYASFRILARKPEEPRVLPPCEYIVPAGKYSLGVSVTCIKEEAPDTKYNLECSGLKFEVVDMSDTLDSPTSI